MPPEILSHRKSRRWQRENAPLLSLRAPVKIGMMPAPRPESRHHVAIPAILFGHKRAQNNHPFWPSPRRAYRRTHGQGRSQGKSLRLFVAKSSGETAAAFGDAALQRRPHADGHLSVGRWMLSVERSSRAWREIRPYSAMRRGARGDFGPFKYLNLGIMRGALLGVARAFPAGALLLQLPPGATDRNHASPQVSLGHKEECS